jgi:hypothetical protein
MPPRRCYQMHVLLFFQIFSYLLAKIQFHPTFNQTLHLERVSPGECQSIYFYNVQNLKGICSSYYGSFSTKMLNVPKCSISDIKSTIISRLATLSIFHGHYRSSTSHSETPRLPLVSFQSTLKKLPLRQLCHCCQFRFC